MCGRYYTVEQPRKKNSPDYITYRSPKQTDLPISYNIAPSQKVLTIRFNPETRARTLDALQWALIPYWVKDPNRLPDHQRPSSRPSIKRHHSVTIFHQLSRARNGRQAFAKRRCLIPADGFYEWRKTANPNCR